MSVRPPTPLLSCGVLAVTLCCSHELLAQAINGYAEQLRPKAARAGLAPDAVYAPVGKPMDEGQVPEIEMFVGESRVFPTPGVGRIAVGNGAILTAAALDNKEVI